MALDPPHVCFRRVRTFAALLVLLHHETGALRLNTRTATASAASRLGASTSPSTCDRLRISDACQLRTRLLVLALERERNKDMAGQSSRAWASGRVRAAAASPLWPRAWTSICLRPAATIEPLPLGRSPLGRHCRT